MAEVTTGTKIKFNWDPAEEIVIRYIRDVPKATERQVNKGFHN
jgi:hypothetical protein